MTSAIFEKNTAIFVKTLPGPSVSSSEATGPSHSTRQMAETRSDQAIEGRACAGTLFAERGLRIGIHFAVLAVLVAAGQECGQAGSPAEEANQGGHQNDQRERHVEGEDRDERCGSETKHDVVLERSPADPHYGFQDDRQHRRLE